MHLVYQHELRLGPGLACWYDNPTSDPTISSRIVPVSAFPHPSGTSDLYEDGLDVNRDLLACRRPLRARRWRGALSSLSLPCRKTGSVGELRLVQFRRGRRATRSDAGSCRSEVGAGRQHVPDGLGQSEPEPDRADKMRGTRNGCELDFVPRCRVRASGGPLAPNRISSPRAVLQAD
jgi:hypothetical protein